MSLTAEERAKRNAEGHERGCCACPICGDSHGWKPFHETPYALLKVAGEVEVLHPDTPPEEAIRPANVNALMSMSALCVDCFPELTPEERLPYYLTRANTWLAEIPKPVLKLTDGKVQPDERDEIRYSRAVAETQKLIDAVAAAVRAGK